MTIRAAADGSALGNPGPAGWAWYVDDSCWAAGGWKHATNNQAELTAVLQFFRATAHLDEELLILCDSQYVINCVTKWMPGWKRKGWRKADGKPVMNVELLQEIDAELPGRHYRFEWVKGHANHPLNEAADSRARAVSEAYQRGTAIPAGPGFVRPGERAATRPSDTRLAPAEAPEVSPPAVLFDFDEPAATETVDVVVTLSAAEFDRLSARARTRGVRPEQVLRDLI
ncbi:ribonuclease HI [Frigoribacterium sp. UYMn621]|jgi:ribonuclease HI